MYHPRKKKKSNSPWGTKWRFFKWDVRTVEDQQTIFQIGKKGRIFYVSVLLYNIKNVSLLFYLKIICWSSNIVTNTGSPGGSDGKESACNVGDLGLIPGLARSPGGGHGNPLQYSCWRISRDIGTRWATDHGVSKSRARVSD